MKVICFHVYMMHTCVERIKYQPAVKRVGDFDKKEMSKSSGVQAENQNSPNFTGIFTPWKLRTTLESKSDRNMYMDLSKNLDSEGKKMLDYLLKNGVLLKQDTLKQTTLSNLHKMINTDRAEGLDGKVLLKSTINAIANPYSISQILGDIPTQYEDEVYGIVKADSLNREKANQTGGLVSMKGAYVSSSASKEEVKKELNNIHSGSCVAASIEFNLASENPAEFSRFAEELSSPKLSATKSINLDSISDNTLDTIWLLNAFEIPYEIKDFKTAKVKLAPDKNAVVRAKIQTKNQDHMERNPIDVLMQSTFMNVGSQQTYDALTDTRAGKFSSDSEGLIDIEKTFVESVVRDRNITSVVYQKVDTVEKYSPNSPNADGEGKVYEQKVVGYELSNEVAKKQIMETLNKGENVVVGYTFTDSDNNILGGHEVTISGVRVNSKGEEEFIYNDTDADGSNPKVRKREPKYVKVDEFIPKIHHAGIPTEIAERDVNYPENWKIAVDEFQAMIKNRQTAQ